MFCLAIDVLPLPVGDAKRHPAVAEAELGDLVLDRNSPKLHILIAPVELEGITGIVLKGNECLGRSLALFFPPGTNITADGVTASFIPFTLQLLEQDLRPAAVLDRLGFVFRSM